MKRLLLKFRWLLKKPRTLREHCDRLAELNLKSSDIEIPGQSGDYMRIIVKNAARLPWLRASLMEDDFMIFTYGREVFKISRLHRGRGVYLHRLSAEPRPEQQSQTIKRFLK